MTGQVSSSVIFLASAYRTCGDRYPNLFEGPQRLF